MKNPLNKVEITKTRPLNHLKGSKITLKGRLCFLVIWIALNTQISTTMTDLTRTMPKNQRMKLIKFQASSMTKKVKMAKKTIKNDQREFVFRGNKSISCKWKWQCTIARWRNNTRSLRLKSILRSLHSQAPREWVILYLPLRSSKNQNKNWSFQRYLIMMKFQTNSKLCQRDHLKKRYILLKSLSPTTRAMQKSGWKKWSTEVWGETNDS